MADQFEYACQVYDESRPSGSYWRLVGVGPTTLDGAQEDARAWERDGFTTRIVYRRVPEWWPLGTVRATPRTGR